MTIDEFTTDDLARTLRSHASATSDGAPPVAAVQRRARQIRNRRRAGVLGVAGAVAALAVAVPAIVHGNRTPDVQPLAPVPSLSPSVDPDTHISIDLGTAPSGPAPLIPYAVDNVIHLPSGKTEKTRGPWRLSSFAPMDIGGIVAEHTDAGAARIRMYGDVTRVTDLHTDGTVFAVTRQGNEVVFPMDSTDIGVISRNATPPNAGGTLIDEVGTAGHGRAEPIAVTGPGLCFSHSDTRGEGPVIADGCAIYWNASAGGAFTTTGAEVTTQIAGLEHLTAVAGDGRLAGAVQRTDSDACDGVLSPTSEVQWTACQDTLGRFSPNDAYIVGLRQTGQSPTGAGSLRVLDSTTGEQVLRFDLADHATVTDYRWESDSSLIALVNEQGPWSLIRIRLDGTYQRVVEPVSGVGDTSPILLPMS